MIVKESLGFNREGSPIEKMNIGTIARLREISLEELSPPSDPDARAIKTYLCNVFGKPADDIFLLADIENSGGKLVNKIIKYIKENRMISGGEITEDVEVNFYETSIGAMASEHNTWGGELIWGDLNTAITLGI